MAYITIANAQRIIYTSDVKDLKFKGRLYKIPIYFFSHYEENSLLAIQELLKDPETYFTEIYKPYKPVDTYTMIYEGRKPAYHDKIDCMRLNSDYENFKIPEAIKERGKQVIEEFRIWFRGVEHLIDKPDVLAMRMEAKWGIKVNPQAIVFENSGVTEIENISIGDIEQKIDQKIKDAGRFYYKSDKNKLLLGKFSKYTFLAYKNEPIRENNTEYSDIEIKTFLKEYDKTFKKPLKKMLIEYYRLKHNPDIQMEGYLLEGLGFKTCGHCY